MKLVVVTPRVSEKAYRLVTTQNTYVFDVPMNANKQEIATAVGVNKFDGRPKVAKASIVPKRQSVRLSWQTAT